MATGSVLHEDELCSHQRTSVRDPLLPFQRRLKADDESESIEESDDEPLDTNQVDPVDVIMDNTMEAMSVEKSTRELSREEQALLRSELSKALVITQWYSPPFICILGFFCFSEIPPVARHALS
jgi:hypothetical protein